MAKKKQTKSGQGTKSVRKKGSLGGKLMKTAVVVGLIGGSGWWLFLSDSDSKIRESCLKSLSLMVDRLDEASHAWEKRSFPGEDEKNAAGTRGSEVNQKSETKAAVSSEDEVKEPRSIKAPESNEAASQHAVNTRKSSKKKTAEPPGEVTEKDKEQLRNLLRDIQEE